MMEFRLLGLISGHGMGFKDGVVIYLGHTYLGHNKTNRLSIILVHPSITRILSLFNHYLVSPYVRAQ
jgi:hypothetical protein